MMNKKLMGVAAMVAAVSCTAQGAGFALYGGSAKGMALGGAVMGKAVDGSANFYNPATISDFTNTVITVGMGLEAPSADVSVEGAYGTHYSGRMNPGAFLLPHAYVVQPIGWGFTFGLGCAPEFGLGTEYSDNWPLNWNTTETTVEGFVINPNLAYSITEDWSVAGGFRLLYFTFEQYSKPQVGPYGTLHTHLEGDNHFSDFGWQVSSRYKILKNLSAGVMYRSYIDTRVRGNYNSSVRSIDMPGEVAQRSVMGMSMLQRGDAAADIRLPQSIIAGLNWDVTETVHTGFAATWTRWSSMKKIDFELDGGNRTTPLDWDDVFRFSFGAAWDFHENWTLLGSYVYDMDPCQTTKNVGATMLPPGDRHIGTLGLAWHWNGLEIAACYGLIIMDGRSQKFQNEANPYGQEYEFSSSNGISHQIGLTISYFF